MYVGEDDSQKEMKEKMNDRGGSLGAGVILKGGEQGGGR